MYKKALTPEQALQKLRHYCAYQERAHQEVRDKLFQLGCPSRQHDELISTLIEENYLNEERFAIAFAGGKWRVKRWGRTRIQYELQVRKISKYCIRKALEEIEEDEYVRILDQLAAAKYASLAKHPPPIRYKRTSDYLQGKGFEPALIRKALSKF